jgi:hypothetical protein
MSEVIDNIDIDLSNVDLSRPVIADQIVLARTGEVKVEKTEKGARRLVIPLTLEEPAKSTTGKDIAPGFQTTVGFLIDASGGWTQERANESLAKFKAAVLKLEKVEGAFGGLEPLRGQLVRVHFVPQRKDETRQDVKAWLKAS